MTPLDYGPPMSRWHRRLRRGVIAMLLLSAISVCMVWTVRFAQQIVRVNQQEKLLNFSLPSNSIVVSSDLVGDHGLLNRSDYQLQKPGSFAPSMAPSLIVLNPMPQSRWGQISSAIFLHRLRPAGHSWRLVSVSLQRTLPFDPDNARGLWLKPVLQMPATLSIGSRLETLDVPGESALRVPTTAPFRIYAGQPDPNDDSHFTIRYEHDGLNETIDGYLLPNDIVKLEFRKTKS